MSDDTTTNTDTTDDTVQEVEPGEDGRYDAEHVRSLRDENAKRRTEAKEARDASDKLRTALLDASIREHARGVLADPTDLPRYVDPATLLDDDGMPDADKIKEAATKLVKEKPHHAAKKATADVGQGPRGEPATKPVDTFGDLLRKAAR
jgi:hypothetical protein